MSHTNEYIDKNTKKLKQLTCLVDRLIEEGTPYDGVVESYSALPDFSEHPNELWLVKNSQGTWWLPGNLGGNYYSKGFYWGTEVGWNYLGEVPYQATQAEVDAGTVVSLFVTPKTFNDAAKWGTKANSVHTHTASAISDFQTTVSLNTDVSTSKSKLDGIESGAEVNVNADWEATEGDAEILNKPSEFPPSAHNHVGDESAGISILGSDEVITTGIKALHRIKSEGDIIAYRIDSFEHLTGIPFAGTINISILNNGIEIGTATLSAQSTKYDDTLFGWNTSLHKDDKLQYDITSNVDVKNFTLTLYYNYTI